MRRRQIIVVSLFLRSADFLVGSGLSRTNSKYRIVRSGHLFVILWSHLGLRDLPRLVHARFHSETGKRIRNRLGIGSVKSNSRIPGVARIPKSIDSHRASSTEGDRETFFENRDAVRSFMRHREERSCIQRSLLVTLGSCKISRICFADVQEFLARASGKGILLRNAL